MVVSLQYQKPYFPILCAYLHNALSPCVKFVMSPPMVIEAINTFL